MGAMHRNGALDCIFIGVSFEDTTMTNLYKFFLVSDWPLLMPMLRLKFKTILIQMKMRTVSPFHILLATVFKPRVSDILFGY